MLAPSIVLALLSLLTLLITLGALILLLDCIWRAVDSLDTALKCLAAAITLLLVKNILLLSGLQDFSDWPLIDGSLDFLAALFFFLAIWKFFHIIRELSGESGVMDNKDREPESSS